MSGVFPLGRSEVAKMIDAEVTSAIADAANVPRFAMTKSGSQTITMDGAPGELVTWQTALLDTHGVTSVGTDSVVITADTEGDWRFSVKLRCLVPGAPYVRYGFFVNAVHAGWVWFVGAAYSYGDVGGMIIRDLTAGDEITVQYEKGTSANHTIEWYVESDTFFEGWLLGVTP